MKQKAIRRLVDVQVEQPVLVLALFTGITLALVPGMAQVETIVALENMMPASAPAVQTLDDLRADGFSPDTLAVQIETTDGLQDLGSPEGRRYIADRATAVRTIPGVTRVTTPRQQPDLLAGGRGSAILIVQAYQGDTGPAMDRISAEIREEMAVMRPDGIETAIVGVPAIQQRLSEMVARDKTVTTLIALALVAVIALVLFQGSPSAAGIPLIVVGASIAWLYGSMGYLGIPLSTLAGAVAALVIGIGIDYSIHMVSAYRHHRDDHDPREALYEAMEETGISIIATSVTTISAFLAFLVGVMPEMHRFGLIMAMGIGYALVLTFLLVPSIFILEEQIGAYAHAQLEGRFDR